LKDSSGADQGVDRGAAGLSAGSRSPVAGGRPFVTAENVKARFFREAFSRPLLDNTLRGVWCEFMLCEALGPECRPVGLAWHPWDLQIGPDSADVPTRIRIQVKNSAVLQTWNEAAGKASASIFNLTWRRRPAYFDRSHPGVPCEREGFLCDLFILCHHPVADWEVADHRNPSQWRFYVLPVIGPFCAVSEVEITALRQSFGVAGKPSSTQRRPGTLEVGIRGRPPIHSLGIEDLSAGAIRQAIGLA
jgi:hypothetical protein